MRVAMLVFPGITQLDLTAPLEFLSRFPELTFDLVGETRMPVPGGPGLQFLLTADYEDCAQADILFVPGGPGIMPLLSDLATLSFLRRQAAGARYVTSVCSGSLVLAAAGLLTGYRATCHWQSLEFLAPFGALPIAERVVIDRNRVTGGGVTSGLDFALVLSAELFGRERVAMVQLWLEYDPQPPFTGGSPHSAPPDVLAKVNDGSRSFLEKRRQAIAEAAKASAVWQQVIER